MTDIESLSEKLAIGGYRFLSEAQIAGLRCYHRMSRDDVRKAAIRADRLRRQRQAHDGSNSFRVVGAVEPDAPIVLKPETRRRKG